MNRSHVIRLNPTPEQEVYFHKARHAYNWALARWKECRAEGRRVKVKDLKAEDNKIKGKKRDRLSFYLANDKFSVDGHTLRVPKLGEVNMAEELRFAGKIMSAVISYRAGWWFVSIAVEVEHETPTHAGGSVGIDLGIETLVTCSDGEKFENQKHYRRGLGRIQGLSKGLSLCRE